MLLFKLQSAYSEYIVLTDLVTEKLADDSDSNYLISVLLDIINQRLNSLYNIVYEAQDAFKSYNFLWEKLSSRIDQFPEDMTLKIKKANSLKNDGMHIAAYEKLIEVERILSDC